MDYFTLFDYLFYSQSLLSYFNKRHFTDTNAEGKSEKCFGFLLQQKNAVFGSSRAGYKLNTFDGQPYGDCPVLTDLKMFVESWTVSPFFKWHLIDLNMSNHSIDLYIHFYSDVDAKAISLPNN